jgi:hypothetical protein
MLYLFSRDDGRPVCHADGCAGCGTDLGLPVETFNPQLDDDSDGLGNECDPCNGGGTPGAMVEICDNSFDDDCTSGSDSTDCCVDADGDSYFPATGHRGTCVPPPGPADCNDGNSAVNPGGSEGGGSSCGDGEDNDCDGDIDGQDETCWGQHCTGPEIIILAAGSAAFNYASINEPDCSLSSSVGACGSNAPVFYAHVIVNDPNSQSTSLTVCDNSFEDIEISDFNPAAGCAETCRTTVSSSSCVEIPLAGSTTFDFALRKSGLTECGSGFQVSFSLSGGGNPTPVTAADNDLDEIDDSVDTCVDYDADGWGTGANRSGCANGTELDCDDSSPVSHPGGTELCDFLDNDCNGQVDDNAPVLPIFIESFEGDPFARGWSTSSGGQGEVVWTTASAAQDGPNGPVALGSQAAFSGPDHEDLRGSTFSTLMSPTLDTTAFPTGNVGLAINSYTFNEGGCGADFERVEMSYDGIEWLPVGGCTVGGLQRAYDGQQRWLGWPLVGGAGRSTLFLRFRFEGGSEVARPGDDGWYVNDVRVYACP